MLHKFCPTVTFFQSWKCKLEGKAGAQWAGASGDLIHLKAKSSSGSLSLSPLKDRNSKFDLIAVGIFGPHFPLALRPCGKTLGCGARLLWHLLDEGRLTSNGHFQYYRLCSSFIHACDFYSPLILKASNWAYFTQLSKTFLFSLTFWFIPMWAK